jgi:D-glycero-D-manno-heptose 1,7-bisphosphate phosphatase
VTSTGRAEASAALPAVILAGGLGTRLGALTAATPKPLIPVCGRPVLDWILTSLARTGVRDVLLLVGYLGDQIAAHVGDGRQWGLRARCSVEASPLGTGGALAQARERLPDAFLLIYGDSYLALDYAALSHAFERSGSDAMMVVYEDPDGATHVPPNVAIDGPLVTQYSKGGAGRLSHIDAGVVVLKRRVLDGLPPRDASALETDLYPVLATARRLYAYPTLQRFYDAGTPERLRELERVLCP